MKRVYSLLAVIVIGIILVSDIALIIKYYQKPHAYALMEHISFLHYFLLHKNGMEFAFLKASISGLMLASWIWRFIYPSKVTVLGYATFVYSLMWILIGAIVLTGITGLLQFSANLPINVLDFSPLVNSVSAYTLAPLVLVIIMLPLALMCLPRLNNQYWRVSL